MDGCIVRAGFWNIGWTSSRLSGAKANRHRRNLCSQVAALWCSHELDILLLCEVGDHSEGLPDVDVEDVFSDVLDAIHTLLPSSRAGTADLRFHMCAAYIAIYDARSLRMHQAPHLQRADDVGSRQFMELVVRCHSDPEGKLVSIFNMHLFDSKNRGGLKDSVREQSLKMALKSSMA